MVKIGIIGTGRIAHRFVPEARIVDNVEISIVCNPHIESARLFAEEFGIEAYTDSVEEMVEYADAVYVASPHQSHYEYTKLLLQKRVHVLCEKPMSFSEQEARELFELARENGCILIEGIKTAYCPGFNGILDIVKSGKIGQVYDVEACFSKLNSANVRECWDTRFGGSFTELGTYSLLPIVKLLGSDCVQSVVWSAEAVTGVDSYTKIMFSSSRGTATAKTGIGVKSEGQLLIAGTNGYILVPSPWWLTRKFQVRYEDSNRIEEYQTEFEGQGLRYEIQSFVECIGAMNTARVITERTGDAQTEREVWDEIMDIVPVGPEESVWTAKQMEAFLSKRKVKDLPKIERNQVRFWGHRGCSMKYPENTLEAFQAAAELRGIAGIELDTQLTKDGEVVVIHDETVDRTTTGRGKVCEYLLDEIKELHITGSGVEEPYVSVTTGKYLEIPTLREVFELLAPYCKSKGLMLNIELKNSVNRYEGMEQKVLDLVSEFGIGDNIVYSSFLHDSVGLMKQLNPDAKTGTLAGSIYDCLEGAIRNHADALHPWNGGLDMNNDIFKRAEIKGMDIRVWNGEEPLYGQNRVLKEFRMEKYQLMGATDIITNVPEIYL